MESELKIKPRLQQESVVGGFTAPKESRKYLGAVVLGAYTRGKLPHYGYVGSGFKEKGLKDAVEQMKPLFIDKCPFVNPPNIKEKIQWIQPKLVCEIKYTELTAPSSGGLSATGLEGHTLVCQCGEAPATRCFG